MDGRVVQLVVEDGPAIVLDGVLDGGHGEDEDERDRVEARIRGPEYGKELRIVRRRRRRRRRRPVRPMRARPQEGERRGKWEKQGGALTERMMMNKKYTLAMFRNWKYRFFGTKLSGVYLAVRILLRSNAARGRPSSPLASSGRSRLKKMVRALSSPASEASTASLRAWVEPASELPAPVDSRFLP